uniref:Uncharacterized protein n=1 Tax=Trypanosoma congolense (strain IL3000) TaxID=1068625 RepID=G0ULW9_TRYCI|nr:hypothetical protein, unlikely [Trypanosoma congolense IL3000]
MPTAPRRVQPRKGPQLSPCYSLTHIQQLPTYRNQPTKSLVTLMQCLVQNLALTQKEALKPTCGRTTKEVLTVNCMRIILHWHFHTHTQAQKVSYGAANGEYHVSK